MSNNASYETQELCLIAPTSDTSLYSDGPFNQTLNDAFYLFSERENPEPLRFPFIPSIGITDKLLVLLHYLEERSEEILYVEAQGNYSRVVLEEAPEEEHRILLKNLQVYFEEASFLRVHKSYMVNPKQVRRANVSGTFTYYLEVGEETIPIGRSYLAKLQHQYPQWFKHLPRRRGRRRK